MPSQAQWKRIRPAHPGASSIIGSMPVVFCSRLFANTKPWYFPSETPFATGFFCEQVL